MSFDMVQPYSKNYPHVSRPSGTFRPRWWFILEWIIIPLIFGFMTGPVIMSGSVPFDLLSIPGRWSLPYWFFIFYLVALILGYMFLRLQIGPSPFVETYSLPVSLPERGWSTLVLTPPADDAEASAFREGYEEYGDTVAADLIPGAPSSPPDSPIRIDRDRLEAMTEQATQNILRKYGPRLLAPWNWLANYKEESEISTARVRLARLAMLIDTLPEDNITFEWDDASRPSSTPQVPVLPENAAGGDGSLLDDSLTVVVGIIGGFVIGFIVLLIVTALLSVGWGLAVGGLAWLGATMYLTHRRSVQVAVSKAAYGIAITAMSFPLVAFSPTWDASSTSAQILDFTVLLVYCAIFAAIVGGIGLLAARFVPESDPER